MRKGMLLVMLIGIMACCTGCVSLMPVKEPLPEETIEEFQDAMNAMDVNGMLECMDSGTVKSITAGMDIALGITGAVTGFDLGISAEDLIAALPLFQSFAGSYGYGADYPGVDFEVMETYIKGNRATVYFTEINSGESMNVNMKKEDNKWRMTLDKRVIAEEDADRVIIAGQEESTGDTAGGAGDETGGEASADIEEFKVWDIMNKEKLKKFLTEILVEDGN